MLLVLTAINDDSPTVPALLTDYILNGQYVHISSFITMCGFVSCTLVELLLRKTMNIYVLFIVRVGNLAVTIAGHCTVVVYFLWLSL